MSATPAKLIREIHPEIRVLDATAGLVQYVASDETLDSYNEVIRADGWRFTHFKAGYLKAVNVGFMPVRQANRWDTDRRAYDAQLAAAAASELHRRRIHGSPAPSRK